MTSEPSSHVVIYDSLMTFVIDSSKAVLIVEIATGWAFSGNPIFSTLNNGLSNSVSHMLTGSSSASSCSTAGNDSFLGCAIDKNLALMQVALGGIQSLDTGDSQIVEDEKNRALWMSGLGVAGPAIIAGVMLLLNKFAMALFVSFGPIFILCLLFDQTKQLFSKWLYFGIATTFTTMMLAIMSSLAMKMVGALAASVVAADFLGASTSGFTQVAMQQGGLGLILSTLLITVPPMAGNFFSGALGNFVPQSAFGMMGGNGNMSGSGGGHQGGSGYQGGGAVTRSSGHSANVDPNRNGMRSSMGNQNAHTSNSDEVKNNSMMGNAQQTQGVASNASFNSDRIKSKALEMIRLQ